MEEEQTFSSTEAFKTWQFVQFFTQVQVLVEECSSSVFQTIMNTQRSGRAGSKANETLCGDFPSQIRPPVFLQ